MQSASRALISTTWFTFLRETRPSLGGPRSTRRLSAVVLKWSRARRRNERQGLLVEEEALETAEQECLADEDVRARRREREAERRKLLDQEFVGKFAARVRELFPRCPSGVEQRIADTPASSTADGSAGPRQRRTADRPQGSDCANWPLPPVPQKADRW